MPVPFFRDASGRKVCAYLYGAGGERVGRLDASGAVDFLHYDARGFVTHLSDLAAHVNEQYLYDAFGQPYVYDATGTQSRGQASAVQNNRCLWAAGYEWYPELGLYRCGARFYDPSCGHWLQPDPIGQAGGLNIYTYCGNDPVNQSDLSGLAYAQLDTPTGSNIPALGHLDANGSIDYILGPAGSFGFGDPGSGLYTVHAPAAGTSGSWSSKGTVLIAAGELEDEVRGVDGEAINPAASKESIREQSIENEEARRLLEGEEPLRDENGRVRDEIRSGHHDAETKAAEEEASARRAEQARKDDEAAEHRLKLLRAVADFLLGRRMLITVPQNEIKNAIPIYVGAAINAKTPADAAYQLARVDALRGLREPPGSLVQWRIQWRLTHGEGF